jgi:outer membrane lipoprotein-sorting protein
MKRFLLVITCCCLASVAVFSQTPQNAQADAVAVDVIQKVDKLMNPGGKLTANLIHINKKGVMDEKFGFILYTKDNNQKIIVRVVSSIRSDASGDDLIMIDKNVWFYDARAGRVMKMPSNEAYGDTDFSYGDVLRLNLTDNYTATVLKDTAASWVLNLKAKDRNAPYYRIEYEVKKDNYVPIKGSCYGKNNEIIKTMEYSDVKVVNGKTKPTKVTVKSPYNEGSYSTMTFTAEDLKDYPDNIFNKGNLATRLEENY